MISTDPILALLPEPPEVFERLPLAEQAWRGRLWLVTWSAGFPEDMAWWFARRDASEQDVIDARKTMQRVTDEQIPQMVAGRVYFEAEMARQAALGGQ
jgi:hypothetical protein